MLPVDRRGQSLQRPTLPTHRLPPQSKVPVIAKAIIRDPTFVPTVCGTYTVMHLQPAKGLIPREPVPVTPVAIDPTFIPRGIGTYTDMPLKPAKASAAELRSTTARAFAQTVSEPLRQADDAKVLVGKDKMAPLSPFSLASPLALDFAAIALEANATTGE